MKRCIETVSRDCHSYNHGPNHLFTSVNSIWSAALHALLRSTCNTRKALVVVWELGCHHVILPE